MFNPIILSMSTENTLSGDAANFKSRMDERIASVPDSNPARVAREEAIAGILGPLNYFGLERLGLGDQETSVISSFAERVGLATQQEFEAKLRRNPLFAIDALLAGKQAEVVATSDEDFPESTKDRLQQIVFARVHLRQMSGKALLILNVQSRQEDLNIEDVVNAIIEDSQRGQMADKYPGMVYIKMGEGRQRNHLDILKALGHEELCAEANEAVKGLVGEQKTSIGERPIKGVQNVSIVLPFISTQYRDAYFHSGIILNREAIKAVLESDPLPSLK